MSLLFYTPIRTVSIVFTTYSMLFWAMEIQSKYNNLNIYELYDFYQKICIEITHGVNERRNLDELEELKRLLCQVYSTLRSEEKKNNHVIRASA